MRSYDLNGEAGRSRKRRQDRKAGLSRPAPSDIVLRASYCPGWPLAVIGAALDELSSQFAVVDGEVQCGDASPEWWFALDDLLEMEPVAFDAMAAPPEGDGYQPAPHDEMDALLRMDRDPYRWEQ
tara:strand:- start:34 stop:408 length:375 start_codon:yes stop_codon:yes gene_type:complete